MHLIDLCVLILVVGQVRAYALTASDYTSHSPSSYGELAAESVIGQWNKAMYLLSSLDMANARPDGVKDLRVSLLAARELIDMFIFAYPNATCQPSASLLHIESATDAARRLLVGKKHKEMILVIRSELDAGYETLGNFQDLAHSLVAYNESDVIEARAACLAWRSSFIDKMLLDGFLGHLSTPSTEVLYYRKQSDLSPLFWGSKGAPTPSLSLSGLANLALMTASMLQRAIEDLPTVLSLETVHAPKQNHETFHNYRKLIRSLLAVFQLFPQLLLPPSSTAASSSTILKCQDTLSAPGAEMKDWAVKDWTGCWLHNLWCLIAPTSAYCKVGDPTSILQKAFKDLGSVNNFCFAWSFYTERGEEEEAAEALEQVMTCWANVKAWLQEVQIDEIMKSM